MSGAALHVYDDGLGRLGPMTDLREPADIRTGALTTRERIEACCADAAKGFAPGEVLAVSGRCVIPPSAAELEGLEVGRALVEPRTGEMIAARLTESDWEKWKGQGEAPAVSGGLRRVEITGARLIRRPWDVIRLRDAAIALDLQLLADAETQDLPDGVIAIGEHDLTIAPDAVVYPTVVFDLEHGPVVVREGATIRPGAIVVGPTCIGAGSTIVERAHIKANTAIGPVCKIGGEVGGTIVQGYSNKAHDGHLGDAWLGEWVNLGAATVNSNLLNTYGEVMSRPEPGMPTERTGLAFFGCVLGDHVKTAIGTRIMTGASVGTGTMWAASAPITGAVGRFRWVTDAGDRPHAWDRFEETMRAMMGRRKIAPTPEMMAGLRKLWSHSSTQGAS